MSILIDNADVEAILENYARTRRWPTSKRAVAMRIVSRAAEIAAEDPEKLERWLDGGSVPGDVADKQADAV